MLLHFTSKDIERFWMKVNKTDGCWLWLASKDPFGYGCFQVSGQRYLSRAHRVSYMLAYGDIPDGLLICHACDNPSCVRPDHLWAGTQKENIHDCMSKGRSPFPLGCRRDPSRVARGERVYGAKITAETVQIIRHRHATETVTAAQIARDLGVGRAVVYNILQGKTWRHVI